GAPQTSGCPADGGHQRRRYHLAGLPHVGRRPQPGTGDQEPARSPEALPAVFAPAASDGRGPLGCPARSASRRRADAAAAPGTGAQRAGEAAAATYPDSGGTSLEERDGRKQRRQLRSAARATRARKIPSRRPATAARACDLVPAAAVDPTHGPSSQRVTSAGTSRTEQGARNADYECLLKGRYTL